MLSNSQRTISLCSFLLLLISCLFYMVSSAQKDTSYYKNILHRNEQDTAQVNALNTLFMLYSKVDPALARTYLDQAYTLSKKINYPFGEATALRSYGNYYNSRGYHDSALVVLNKGKQIFEALKDPSGIKSCLNGLGNCAVRTGDYSLALDYYISTAKINERINDISSLANSYQNIGGVHYKQKRFDKALEYFNKSLEIKKSLGDSSSMVNSLNSISIVYTALGDYRKALDLQFYTLDIAKRVCNLYDNALVINNIGVQYHYLNEPDSARIYYEQALSIHEKLDEKQEQILLQINLGGLEQLLGHGEKALIYFGKGLAMAQELGTPYLISAAYQGLADASELTGDYKAALDWQKKHYALKDSLTGESVQTELNELQEKFESEQKDHEIAELEKNETEALLNADRKQTLLILGGTITVSIILIMLLYISRRRALERQQRAELEQKALRAQMNPHFIFNSLGSIQEMYNSGETDLANNYMGDFGKLMRKILDNSGKDLIMLKEELEMLHLYLELEKSRNDDLIEFEMSVSDEIDQYGTLIPPLVIQPFVENAIWHGILPKKKKGKIRVNISPAEEGKALLCEVEDDGMGISSTGKRRSHEPKGIQLTEQRLKTKIKFENLSPGTRVKIIIPYDPSSNNRR